MFNIGPETLITKGLPLSKNFLLDHTTSGAFHYLMGKWTPQFTTMLRPGMSTIPTWEIARNLQIGSSLFLEKLLGAFGGDFILKSALLPDGLASLGQSLDIQVAGFQGNMVNIAGDVQKIAKKAKDIALVFDGGSSFMRINFDKQSLLKDVTSTDLPKIVSIDRVTNVIKNGIEPLRGFL